MKRKRKAELPRNPDGFFARVSKGDEFRRYVNSLRDVDDKLRQLLRDNYEGRR